MTDAERKEWFMQSFLPINPILSSTGADGAYYYARKAVSDMAGKKLPDGKSLTWEELQRRYTDYFAFMSARQAKDPQYTKKENQLLNIEDYCCKNLYVSNYAQSQNDPNDSYLYGIK